MVKDVTNEDRERKYKAPALEKGLDVLELLASTGAAQTSSQIAAQLGRSVSELFRMILTLEARGYIEQVNDHGYGLTNKMFTLGVDQRPPRTLVELAFPYMEELAQRTGQSCHLVVASGEQIVVIARAESPRDLGFSVRIGYRRHIIDSNSGILLVATEQAELRAELLSQLKVSSSPDAYEIFKQRVREAMENRRVRRASDFVSGITDLCCPLQGKQDVQGVLTVPFVMCKDLPCSETQAFDVLTEITQRISTELVTDGY